jgi:hypothetical protein
MQTKVKPGKTLIGRERVNPIQHFMMKKFHNREELEIKSKEETTD